MHKASPGDVACMRALGLQLRWTAAPWKAHVGITGTSASLPPLLSLVLLQSGCCTGVSFDRTACVPGWTDLNKKEVNHRF